jgi:putative thiamine transport system permease protein
MSLVLGPTTPPTLPVLVLRLANDPDTTLRGTAAAAALVQLALVAGAMVAWRCAEFFAGFLGRWWNIAGTRDWPQPAGGIAGGFIALAILVLAVMLTGSMMSLALWSVADNWRFPALLPSGFSAGAWQRALTSTGPLGTSLGLAFLSAVAALALAIACLWNESRSGAGESRRRQVALAKGLHRAERLLFLPLLLPDISFLVGVEVLLLLAGLNGGWFAVTWLHLLFVFPYVFLSLKDSWRALDPRFERIAGALGLSPWRVFWYARLPMMRGAIIWSAAVGCAVSLSLYLPTVLGGEGRIITLATEAISLGSGGDRRLVGAFGILQAAIVATVFAVAVAMRGQGRRRVP